MKMAKSKKKKYATKHHGNHLNHEETTTFVYSLDDTNKWGEVEDFHWFVLDVDTERLQNLIHDYELLEILGETEWSHEQFQVRGNWNMPDIKKVIETYTQGNYIWVDTRRVGHQDGRFLNEEHEKVVKDNWEMEGFEGAVF